MNDLPETFDKGSYSYQDLIGQSPTRLRMGVSWFHAGIGVPADTLGSDDDYYFRLDGIAGTSTTLYHKESGAWVACTL